MGGRGNHRSFGGLKFRRLLKAFILGNGNKIPLRRSCSTKEADTEPDEEDKPDLGAVYFFLLPLPQNGRKIYLVCLR